MSSLESLESVHSLLSRASLPLTYHHPFGHIIPCSVPFPHFILTSSTSSSSSSSSSSSQVIKRIPLDGMRMEMLNDPDMRYGFQIISTCKSFRLEARFVIPLAVCCPSATSSSPLFCSLPIPPPFLPPLQSFPLSSLFVVDLYLLYLHHLSFLTSDF